MTELICKTCGSNGIEKKGELYECEFCGTKYTPAEAENLSVQVVVKNDNSEKIEALLRAGKKSRDMGNWEAAIKYYDEILGLDPDRWEAVFYSAFCTARNCKIAHIASAANLVEKSLKPTYTLIKTKVSADKQLAAVSEVAAYTNEITAMLCNAAIDHYNGIDSQIQYKYRDEMIARWSAATEAARTSGLLIEELFGSKYSALIASALRNAVNLYDKQGRGTNTWLEKALNVLNKYDSTFINNRKAALESNKKNLKVVRIIQVCSLILAVIGIIIMWNNMSNGESWIFSAILMFIGIFGVIMSTAASSAFK